MADLMNTPKTDFKKLSSQYGDFLVPAVRVKIGSSTYSSVTGKETKKGSGLIIHKAETWLCHSEGSSVSVLIGEVYELQASRFKEIASLGEKISLELGYGSKFSQVFKGFVGEIELQYFGTKQYIRITGYDAVYLMTQNVSARYYQEKKYSDVVQEILKNYSSILSTGNVDSTGEQQQPFISAKSMNDYDCITEFLSPLANKEFFIFNGKAYFQPVKSRNKEPSVELQLGRGLNYFRIAGSYANLKVKTAGFPTMDPDSKFVGEASGKADSSQKSVVSSEQTEYFTGIYTPDEATAGNVAEYLLERKIIQRQTAEGKCFGIPEIIPGRCITVLGVQPSYDKKKLWVDRVHHVAGESGFSTEFYVKGWE